MVYCNTALIGDYIDTYNCNSLYSRKKRRNKMRKKRRRKRRNINIRRSVAQTSDSE